MPHQCTNCGRTFADGSKEMLSGCPNCGGNKFQFRPASASDPAPSDAASAAGGSPEGSSDDPASMDAADTDRADASAHPSGTTRPSKDPNAPETPPTRPEKSDTERDTGSWPDPTAEADPDGATDEGGLTDAAARAGAAVRDRLSRTNDDNVPASDPSQTADTPQTTDSHPTHATTDSSVDSESDPDADTAAEDSAQTTARSDVVSREELSAAARDVDADQSRTPPESEPPAAADGETLADTPSEDDQPDLSELRQELNDQFESIKIVSQGQYELNLMELYDRDEYIISLQEDGRYVIEVPDRWREDE